MFKFHPFHLFLQLILQSVEKLEMHTILLHDYQKAD